MESGRKTGHSKMTQREETRMNDSHNSMCCKSERGIPRELGCDEARTFHMSGVPVGGKYVGSFNKNNAPALLAVMLIIKETAITFSIVIIVTKSSDTYRYMYMHEFECLSLDEASESSSYITI